MKLWKNIFGVGVMTGISRIFGFIRDMLIARFLGAGRLSDIFLAAFKLPNLFRDLLGEGALSSIFIPMYTDSKKDEHFAKNVFSWLMVILLGITVIFEICMPFIVLALAPGFADDPWKLNTTVVIARIMFFYVIFICGAAFLSAILNAFSRFILAAFMPVLLNIMLILSLLASLWYGNDIILYVMATTVVISGIIQFWILLSRIRSKHFGLKLIIPKKDNKIKSLFKRFCVSLVGSGFYQITIIIGTLVASFESGAVSWLYYSDRIVQLPFAIIGLAVGTVLISSISNALAQNNMRSVYIQQNSSMKKSMMFIIPCMIGLIILAEPIIRFLFEYGEWSPQSTHNVAMAIKIQCLVLPAMLISQIYSKTLYANQDVKTPVKTSIISLALATIVYVGLFKFIGYLAVPVGIVISGYVKNILLKHACKKANLINTDKNTIFSIFMFLGIGMAYGYVLTMFNINSIIALAIAIGGFGIAYLSTSFIMDKILTKLTRK
ncbi:MAG: murein biosynthesis integral membrane protein MurJ [Alphaproteobacteria bacterium]|nr:murein biosynthesis integral membrane protein MurJ [Alphaproteobacteria bacterium]